MRVSSFHSAVTVILFFEQRGMRWLAPSWRAVPAYCGRVEATGSSLQFALMKARACLQLADGSKRLHESTVDMVNTETHWEAVRHSYDSSVARGVNPKTEGKSSRSKATARQGTNT
jgi:hypothetical protein